MYETPNVGGSSERYRNTPEMAVVNVNHQSNVQQPAIGRLAIHFRTSRLIARVGIQPPRKRHSRKQHPVMSLAGSPWVSPSPSAPRRPSAVRVRLPGGGSATPHRPL